MANHGPGWWDKDNKRRKKMIKGEELWVTAAELGVDATEEATRKPAIAHWAKIRAEMILGIQAEEEAKKKEFEAYYQRKAAFQIEKMWAESIFDMAQDPDKRDQLADHRDAKKEVVRKLLEDGSVNVPVNRTVGYWCEQWCKMRLDRAQTENQTFAKANEHCRYVRRFGEFLKATSELSIIDNTKLKEYREHLIEHNKQTRKKIGIPWETCKAFVKWLVEEELIPLPSKLNSPSMAVARDEEGGSAWDLDDVQRLLIATKEDELTRVFVLLMINCGVRQKDIAKLTADKVNWEQQSISIRRSKHENSGKKNAGLVKYPLWPETFTLLQKLGRKKGLVFHRNDGSPLLMERNRDYDGPPYDDIGKAINRYRIALGIKSKSMDLRKTSSTRLREKGMDKLSADYFLGNADDDVGPAIYYGSDTEGFRPSVFALRDWYFQGLEGKY